MLFGSEHNWLTLRVTSSCEWSDGPGNTSEKLTNVGLRRCRRRPGFYRCMPTMCWTKILGRHHLFFLPSPLNLEHASSFELILLPIH